MHVHSRRAEQSRLSTRANIEQILAGPVDWVYREYDYAVFPMTIHAAIVSGRPQVLMMLERLYSQHHSAPGRALRDVRRDRRPISPRGVQRQT